MFKSLMSKIGRWFQRMGITKTINSVSDFREVPNQDEIFKLIEQWKALYKGFYSEWHDVTYHTVKGPKKRRMSSLNMPKVISQEMATLIFNERCEINIDNEDLAENIKSVLDGNKFNKHFQDYLEYQFALGGMVIKPYFKDDEIKLSFVTPDCFIPVAWDNKGIFEAIFTNQTRKGKKVYTHLEWHLREGDEYVVKNELYVSENGEELGKRIPLDTLYENMDEEVRMKNIKRSLFVYFMPNTANHIDMHSPLGVPIYSHALDTLKSLDVAYDSFEREFRLGKRRIIIPATAVRSVIDEHGNLQRYFDADDEVYQALSTGDMDDSKIQDNTVELRVDEHIAAINALLNFLSMQTGFSSGSFAFDGKSMKTATEVVSENSKTFRTKQSHETIVEEGLIELVEAIIDLAELYELFSRPAEDYETTVAFDDSIAEDADGEVDRQTKLIIGGMTSKKRAIMKVHKVSEKEAEEILREIFAEELRQSPEYEEVEKEVSLFGVRE